jgi:nucleotide-binding universal stress UspA family protein
MSIFTHQQEHIGFQRIVCPVAFSADSHEALRYAIALAKDYHAELFILHCTDRERLSESLARAAIKERMQRLIDKHLQPGEGKAVSPQLVLIEGDPVEAISDKAAELSADLIVMRSRRRPNAVLLGSTAEAVSRTAPCSVLVSHPQERDWVGKSKAITLQRILVAYDYSGDAELALTYGMSLAREYQTELHVLHVLPERARSSAPELAFLPVSSDRHFAAAGRFNTILPPEALLGCQSRQVLREGLPYREILDYAEEQSIDLICLGASGSDYGMRTLFGSNADRVMRQAPCPMFIARPLRPLFKGKKLKQD